MALDQVHSLDQGTNDLAVTPTAIYSGATWNLAGATFSAGVTYHLHADVNGPSGKTVEVLFGHDVAGGGDTAGTQITLNGSEQSVDVNWTPLSTHGDALNHVTFRDPTGQGTFTFYLDNVSVGQTGGTLDAKVPTETVYNARRGRSPKRLPRPMGSVARTD
jgi:hypothetical protein